MRISYTSMIGIAALVLAGSGLTAGSAAAQEPGATVSAGYQFTHAGGGGDDDDNGDSDSEGLNFPFGWYVDVAGDITPALQWVGEVSGAYKSEGEEIADVGAEASLSLHTFLGGVRVASQANPRVTPFGQILFGAARASASFEASGGGSSISVDESATEFAMQIGAGVNAMLSDRVGVRVGASYLRILTGGGDNVIRLSGGVVIPFGR